MIFDRDKPVARLEPVSNVDIPEADRIKALVKSGIASAPRRQLDVGAFLGWPRPRLPEGVTGSGALVRDRDAR